MNVIGNSIKVRHEQGFDLYVLGNREVEMVVVPELGAKIISLKNLCTGREWMWHPFGGLKLFRNRIGDDFSQSPLAGADECLPTIAPCSWQGRELPDHGEVWNVPWKVDSTALKNGMLKTSVRLNFSPFDFKRTIELRGNEIQISYLLNNHGTATEHYLWAFHPLLNLQTGDRLELPGLTRALLNGAAWVDAVTSTIPENNSAKVFARLVSEGLAVIVNAATGDRLEFAWNPAENDSLGLWLTRGGWHGHHHFAIEPTNAGVDTLPLAAAQGHCGVVGVGDSMTWQIRLRIGA
jgi:galactose mutarotase-like enzyme